MRDTPRHRSASASRRSSRSRAAAGAVASALWPEVLLEGTPWLPMWRARETRAVVLASRVALAACAIGFALHHFVVDQPLRLEPASRWATYRFGTAAFCLVLLALTFAPGMRHGAPARIPLGLLTLAIGCLQAKTVEWLPSVPYLYAFALTVAGVLALRTSVLGALGLLAACFAAQWAFAWRHVDIPQAKLVSAGVLSATLVVLFRSRMASDVRSFLSEKRELAAQKRLIETQMELHRVKNRLFTNVSHELRTPLTLMLAPIDSLLSGATPLSDEARDDLELMRRNGQRLLRQINALLALSRLDAHRELLRLEEVDAVAVVRELVEGARAFAASRHLELTFVAEDPIPPFPLDREKVETIVQNLIANAIRFTDGTQASPGSATVRCAVRGGRFLCAVEDSGIGIPADQLAVIFERFRQAERPSPDGRGGSGIGLALVKELTEFHLGSISVASRVGHGTTFTLELPMDRAVYPADRVEPRVEPVVEGAEGAIAASGPAATPPRAASRPQLVLAPELEHAAGSPPAEPAPAAPDARRPLVLVVDDHREILSYVARQLAREYRVLTAEDADAAQRLLARELPAIILCDVMMPKRSGTELLRALRQDPRTRRVPVILLTARADVESKIQNLEVGADDYLTKPFEVPELKARIRALLENRKLERELAEKGEHLARVNLDLVVSRRRVFLETMEAFALALEAKSPLTHGHSRRVSILAEGLATFMGLSTTECEMARIAGVLHDVGMIGIPDAVLEKPDALTDDERAVLREHSRLGYRMISAVRDLEDVARAILHQHERVDGTGYPDGLAGSVIPFLSRVLAVCDTYDAITSDSPFRSALDHRAAIETLERCSGTQLDPACVRAFVELNGAAAPEFPELRPRLDGARGPRASDPAAAARWAQRFWGDAHLR